MDEVDRDTCGGGGGGGGKSMDDEFVNISELGR